MQRRLSFDFFDLLKIVLIYCSIGLPVWANAQSPFKGFEHLFTPPKNYVVNYVSQPPVIDDDINDPVWQQAAWTDDFADIEGELKPKPALLTRVKMLWGDSCLYIAGEIHDPNVWAYLKHHDDIVFNDNDFEVFVNPNNTTHQYFEMEFNALNTLWDLFLNKPYHNGGNALFSWTANTLHSATKIQGTINDPTDTDTGWTIEIALSFKDLSLGNDVQIPIDGTTWRINFSRVEWDTKAVDGKYVKLKDHNGRNLPEHNWVWSPQGVVDMHFPERWGYLQFRKDDKPFLLPYAEQQKRYLWLVYYKQKEWFKIHHVYQRSLKKLGVPVEMRIDGQNNNLQLEATDHQFMALIINLKGHITWTINQEGLVVPLKNREDE